MKGFLTSVAPPHVLRHLPEDRHDFAIALALPLTRPQVAKHCYVSTGAIDDWWAGVRETFGLPGDAAGRVAWTRLFYGIDRCPCQNVVAV